MYGAPLWVKRKKARQKVFKVKLEKLTNLGSISSRELPHFCITVGQRGHPDAHRHSGEIPRQDHLLCGGRLGGEVPGIGEGAA